MHSPDTSLQLGARLAQRLLPLALLIWLCISLALPAAFYSIGRTSLQRTATYHAQELAREVESLVLEVPHLWQYQTLKYAALLERFLRYKNVVALRVFDSHGQEVTDYRYVLPTVRPWWDLQVPEGQAYLIFNDRHFGTVEVVVSGGPLVFVTLGLLVGCTVFGGSLALSVYTTPMRVVSRMEQQLTAMVQSVQEKNKELEQRAAENSQLVETLQQTLGELQAKNAELDSFVYSVSHDLKAPLVTLQGMSSLLLEDYGEQLEEDGRYYVERLQANTRHMERLILDLLALSRIGREARNVEVVPLDELVDEVLLEQAEAMSARQITMVRHPLGSVVALRTQMLQVISNVLGNAVKYLGDTPGPTIEIGRQERQTETVLYVKDNGIGIDPAYHAKIFEVFQRLQDLDVEGSGVGLAIVKKIIDAAGGRIWVESARGQGATFHFTWPKQRGDESHAAEPRRDHSAGGGQSRSCHVDDAGLEGRQAVEQGLLGERWG